MTTPASGEADSPMAKRGCVPRSSSATRRPSRRAIVASSDPPKPDPTIARSDSSGAVTQDRRSDLLRAVHGPEPFRAARRAATGVEPLHVPQVGKDAPSTHRHAVLHD